MPVNLFLFIKWGQYCVPCRPIYTRRSPFLSLEKWNILFFCHVWLDVNNCTSGIELLFHNCASTIQQNNSLALCWLTKWPSTSTLFVEFSWIIWFLYFSKRTIQCTRLCFLMAIQQVYFSTLNNGRLKAERMISWWKQGRWRLWTPNRDDNNLFVPALPHSWNVVVFFAVLPPLCFTISWGQNGYPFQLSIRCRPWRYCWRSQHDYRIYSCKLGVSSMVVPVALFQFFFRVMAEPISFTPKIIFTTTQK